MTLWGKPVVRLRFSIFWTSVVIYLRLRLQGHDVPQFVSNRGSSPSGIIAKGGAIEREVNRGMLTSKRPGRRRGIRWERANGRS